MALGVCLALTAGGCSSQISPMSTVRQGGFSPGSAPPQAAVAAPDVGDDTSSVDPPVHENPSVPDFRIDESADPDTLLAEPPLTEDLEEPAPVLLAAESVADDPIPDLTEERTVTAHAEPAPAATAADGDEVAESSEETPEDVTAVEPVPTAALTPAEEPEVAWDALPTPLAMVLETLPPTENRPDEEEPPPELVRPDDDRLLEDAEEKGPLETSAASAPVVAVTYDIPLESNAKILKYIEVFQTSRRESFGRGLARSKKYEKMMKEIFRELELPTDLYYLALIESAYKPRAYSRARATGIWQFIASTGRLYGLRRTHWVEQRRDPEKSTRAAARHLRDLHQALGSWPLAMAAYNAGTSRVKRAIRKARSRDFWKLRLPAQTRNYVPAFYAALIIAKEPERYGFSPDFEAPLRVEQVEIEGGTKLSVVASLVHSTPEKIKDLNPELRQSVTPPGAKYLLNIPPGRSEELLAGLAKLPKQKITTRGQYRIKSGDTLSTIAAQFGATIEAIQGVNNLPGHFIRAGDQLMIPGQEIAAPSRRASGPVSAIPASGKYRVRGGDSLWAISQRYGVSLESLLAWNNLDASDTLRVGRLLTLRERMAVQSVALSTSGGSSDHRYYHVRKGDNLWSISRKFDITLKDILQVNKLRSSQPIYPGDRLLIPTESSL